MRRTRQERERKKIEELEHLAWLARLVFGIPHAEPVPVPVKNHRQRHVDVMP
jgi:hypothetical protein